MAVAQLVRLLLRSARCALACCYAALLLAVPFPQGAAAVPAGWVAGPWQLSSWRELPAGHSDQGLATVVGPDGTSRIVTRGNADVPDRVQDNGWWHVGDPGSTAGYLLDAFQGPPWMHAKLFVLTAPNGERSRWRHALGPGEQINNSFAAIAPSGRWFLSGEWGTMTRLLEFPTPVLNPITRPGGNLPLAATIRLTRAVRNVQGCSFASATQLVCSTNDRSRDLWGVPRQLLAVTLSHPLDGRPQVGVPRLLGSLPQVSACGTAETEGIDIHDGRLLVVAHERGWCVTHTLLFTYRLRDATT